MDSKQLFLTLDKEKTVTSMPFANVFSYYVEIHRSILNIGSTLSIEAASSHICRHHFPSFGEIFISHRW